ncbi:MAG TPA: DUF998 domain-containing protein [Acidimicrobiia bacterium]
MTGILGLLAASLAALATAPTLMPASYSVLTHTTSESGAQGVQGAWLARLGFLCLGLAVLALTNLAGPRWGVWGRVVFRTYSVAMIGAAVFSHVPWQDIPYDVFEDSLHSVAASVVGTAFIAGVLVVTLRRRRDEWAARTFDAIALVVAAAIPIVMFNVEASPDWCSA